MPEPQKLVPAQQLASTNKTHFPNESVDYRKARNALITEEMARIPGSVRKAGGTNAHPPDR